jgi:hypothetical protein
MIAPFVAVDEIVDVVDSFLLRAGSTNHRPPLLGLATEYDGPEKMCEV